MQAITYLIALMLVFLLGATALKGASSLFILVIVGLGGIAAFIALYAAGKSINGDKS